MIYLLPHFQTEVIVNTVAEDLALDKGAVSNAILGAAGPKLQKLVDGQNASGTPGEVIVTDGCKLKSKQVFHVIASSALIEKPLRAFRDSHNTSKLINWIF